MTNKIKITVIKPISVLLALVMIMSLSLTFFISNIEVKAEDASAGIIFKNISDDGDDKISMTNERTFEVTVPLESGSDAQAVISSGISWSLSRETGMLDAEKFPCQYLGGDLAAWTQFGRNDALFTIRDTAAGTMANGTPAIKMTFTNKLFFNGRAYVNSNRNDMLDYVGEYTLACKTDDSTVLGETQIRFNPYDSYRTAEEFASELVEAASYANSRDDMYAEIKSLGETTEGRDMPYIIIADSKESIDNYRKIKEIAETDPVSLQAQVEAGILDYRVPILYSNIHADETNGADAPMNFVWKLVKSDQTENQIEYNMLTDLTETGKSAVESERAAAGLHTSSLLEDWPTYLGAVNEGRSVSGVLDLDTYYEQEEKELDVNALLGDVFFIVVPEENMDGRYYNTRTNANGFDINRDNLFQTQVETQNMTAMIAAWNPIAFMEFHGFVSGFQIEPCSPPHEPNVEYDLMAEMLYKGGEAFGAGAVSNNDAYNSYVMPLRDYLETDSEGNPYWRNPWDDMSTNYTPQYSSLHGTAAYTVEIPASNQEGADAMAYGMVSHSAFVAENKDTMFKNQLEIYKRGIENIDADSVRPWYVDVNDNKGAEADIFRPVSDENNNYFPEYYVIPVDAKSQRNLAAAFEMEEFLIRNGVTVSKLTTDAIVNNVTYKAGSIVVDMHQAKRNVANAALYQGVLITGWGSLYSEPVTAFDLTRGFDCSGIRKAGAFDGLLSAIETAEEGSTNYTDREGNVVVIENSGVEAVHAVNALLGKGAKVGYITQGEYKGNFAVSYDDFKMIKEDHVLTAYGVAVSLVTQELKPPKIYIAGRPAQSTNGFIDYRVKYSNLPYSHARFAFEEQMGFELTYDYENADIIFINRSFRNNSERDGVLAKIADNTPVILSGYMNAIPNLLPDGSCTYVNSNGSYDALTTVEYLSDSPVTYSYSVSGDTIMYGYGGNYFTTLPEGATALIKTTEDDPLEGFFRQEALDAFKGQITAFEYQTDDIDLTAFANTIISKGHQQDDYRYITNAIYNKMLGDELILEPEPLDTQLLEYVLEYADNVIAENGLDGVIGTVKARFEASYANAKAVLEDVRSGNPAVSQSDVDKAAEDLLHVFQYLEFKGDKTDLTALIAIAERFEAQKADYIQSAYTPFETALAAARTVAADVDAMNDEIDSVWNALAKAMADLRLIPNKDKLAALIIKANSIDTSLYTEESVALLTSSITQTTLVLEDEDTDEDTVGAAEISLINAMDGLILLGADGDSDNDGTSSNDDVSSDSGLASAPINPKTGDAALPVVGLIIMICTGSLAVFKMKKQNS